ncbi:MAG: phosphatase PAP2 family protein [Gammaproteobacteria bacterium]|nr:phosphatase PAP2 family protein [Gammaproteobacteria bacterium]MDH5650402.1 phosphatase PAP2 family protein [Gammaproteobacteria bacterium]
MGVSTAAINAAISSRYTLVDRWTLSYMLIASFALFWHFSALPLYLQVLLPVAHALIFWLIYSLPQIRRRGGVGEFLGDWYPLMLILGFYSEVGEINRAVGIHHDEPLQQMEAMIFGSQVAMEWIRAWPNPVFSWFVHLGYALYYFVVVGTPLVISRLVGRAEGQRLLLLALITFYTCYTIFLIMPTAGPLYAFPPADNEATRTGTAVIVAWLLKTGDAWGSAFPSAHVAVTAVLTIGAFLVHRAVGLFLFPIMVLLSIATVYGQIHYAVDALGGLILAGLVLLFRKQLCNGIA